MTTGTNQVRPIGEAMGLLVDFIDRQSKGKHKRPSPQQSMLMPDESAFNLLSKASEQRGKVVLVWCETDGLADMVAINLIRTISIERNLATLVVDYIGKDEMSFSASLLASMMVVPLQNLMAGQIDDNGWNSMASALGKIHDSCVHRVEAGENSLLENLRNWQGEMPDGEQPFILLRGLGILDVMPGNKDRSHESSSQRLLAIARKLSVVSELALQKGVSIFVVLGSLYMDADVQGHLFYQKSSLMGISVDSCFVELKSESLVTLTYQSVIGRVATDYRFSLPIRRIEWGPADDGSPQSGDGDECRNKDVYLKTRVCPSL